MVYSYTYLTDICFSRVLFNGSGLRRFEYLGLRELLPLVALGLTGFELLGLDRQPRHSELGLWLWHLGPLILWRGVYVLLHERFCVGRGDARAVIEDEGLLMPAADMPQTLSP